MSKTRIIIHIVFCTKNRKPTIPLTRKRELYKYIYGILRNKRCDLLRMNGLSDHIHLLINLHPSIALSDLIKEIKISTTLWMRNNDFFKGFEKWGEGYYGASVGPEGEQTCINYILQQEEHHLGKDFLSEVKEMSLQHHLLWDERDWEV